MKGISKKLLKFQFVKIFTLILVFCISADFAFSQTDSAAETVALPSEISADVPSQPQADSSVVNSSQTQQNSSSANSSSSTSSSKKAKKIKLTKEQKAALKLAAKQEKENEKNRQKFLRRQKKDKYTGWIYIPESKFTISNGNIKIYMNGRTGCFGLYALPENLHPIPLLVNYDSYSSSYFSVKIGNKIYRLNRENGVKTEARRTPYGAQMAYTINSKAQIVVDFSFMPSIASSSRVDMLRVTIYSINIGKHLQSYAIKGVFDTLLGENTQSHFSTATERKINSERQFLDMTDQLWIRSSDETTSIQFLLCGKGISNPRAVTLANKDIISNQGWIPTAQENKSFSSVLSYNNSALAVNWKTAYLDPLKADIITFYISVETDGNIPAGKKFLASLKEGKTALSAKLPDVQGTTTVAPTPETVDSSQLETPYWENMPVIPESPEGSERTISSTDEDGLVTYGSTDFDVIDYKNSSSINPENQFLQNKDSTSNKKASSKNKNSDDERIPVDFNSQNVPRESSSPEVLKDPQLDSKYIQSLIDRIEKLENDETLVDRKEIESLNKELDEIFAKLNILQN